MNTEQIIYVTDPLCLWCYGSASIVEEFYDETTSAIQKEMIHGGLFPNERAKLCDQAFIDYLKAAASRVTEMTGKPFTKPFWSLLEQDDFYYDTEPSARAVVTLKNLINTEIAIKYAHDIQYAFFVQGKNVMDPAILAMIATAYKIGIEEFLSFYNSQQSMDLLKQEYSESKQLGVTGFPALIYINENKGFRLSAGYTKKENLHHALKWAKNQCMEPELSAQSTCSDEGCSV